jgi:hypothetical protein
LPRGGPLGNHSPCSFSLSQSLPVLPFRGHRPSPTPHPPQLLPIRHRRSGLHRSDFVISVRHRCTSRASAHLPHPDTGGAAPELGRPSPDGVPRRCARILLHLPVRTQELVHPSPTPRPPRLHPVRPSSPSRRSPAHLDMPSSRAPSGIGDPRGTRRFRGRGGECESGIGSRTGIAPPAPPRPVANGASTDAWVCR